MTPSSLKFVAVNFLGQPLAVLVSDGEIFRYLSITESKSYEGNVSGETFAKYAPGGFQPEQTFYWLVGRFSPGIIQIRDVSRDEDGRGYWFKMNYKQSDMMSLVLFDPQGLVIRRHLLALQRAVANLERHCGATTQELAANPDLAWAVERGLQLCAQNAIDLATHIAVSSGRDVPDYAAAMIPTRSSSSGVSRRPRPPASGRRSGPRPRTGTRYRPRSSD